MAHSKTLKFNFAEINFSLPHLYAVMLLILLQVFSLFAQENVSSSAIAAAPQASANTITIDEVKDAQIFAFGKNVVIKKEAGDVLVWGGDITIEGRIEGDVAAFGGSIIQKEGAFIGGDVIIFGGTYRHESSVPLRIAGKETIMYAGGEESLRNLTQNPVHIFAPEWSWSFLAQRFLSTLFWFIISLALTTIAPGAVSRSVARFQLSTLKVVAIGCLGLMTTIFGVIIGLKFLPTYLSAIISLMAIVMLILAYVFGRVTLQVSAGKWLQKRLWSENKHSESATLLIGAFVWTMLLSVPYVWIAALFLLFAASIGIVLTTARGADNWQKS